MGILGGLWVVVLALSLIYGFEWLVEWWCKSLSWFGGVLGGRWSGVGWVFVNLVVVGELLRFDGL